MFTDTHCHLLSDDYNNINEIINNAQKNKVNRFINNGCDRKANEEILNLINKYKEMYGAIGIHPTEIDDINDDDFDFIEKNIDKEKVVAIGEIGLDYHYEGFNKEKQQEIFRKQLQIAQNHHIPVIIHSRDATKDTIDILKEYKVSGIIHSFSGSLETAKIYIKMGFLLGVNGVVTFKNCNLKDVLKNIDLKNIVLETDSPYLSPVPFRGTKNEPKNVYVIAKFLSDLYKIDINDLATITNDNIKRIFDI